MRLYFVPPVEAQNIPVVLISLSDCTVTRRQLDFSWQKRIAWSYEWHLGGF